MGIEPTSEACEGFSGPRAVSMTFRLVASKNRNEVRPKTSVTGPIAPSPSPPEGLAQRRTRVSRHHDIVATE
jgi:hypothetical protein